MSFFNKPDPEQTLRDIIIKNQAWLSKLQPKEMQIGTKPPEESTQPELYRVASPLT